jgi:hypothetical protein
MFNKYLRYSVIKTYSNKNQYTKFSSLMGNNTPVHEVFNVVMPDHMLFNYKFIIWTEYIEQMNSLIEKINFETNDYWGVENGLRFRTYVDSYINTTEVQNDKDRLVKTEFDLVLRGYLLPELFSPGLDGFKSTTEKIFTKKKVIFGMEVVSTSWKPIVDKNISDKWRSQTFPNIVSGTEPPPAPISFKDDNIERRNQPIPPITAVTIIWRTVPSSLSDYGEEGWKSYDPNYYYYYTKSSLHRVPINLFDDISPSLVPIEGQDGYDSEYYYIYVSEKWKRTPILTFNTFY